MKLRRIMGLSALILVLATSGAYVATADSPQEATTGALDAPIIIDHTCTDLSQIPDYWIEQAKNLTLHYAHTSHGSQINSGILALELRDPYYDVAIRTSASSPGLPDAPGSLRIYDGNPPETYITPEDYWYSDDGRTRTRAVVETGLFDYSMWSWCGQVSGGSEAYIDDYLAQIDGMDQDYPDTDFIYMTGHVDGSGESGNLHQRNNQIRNYCLANNKILFDFADIESYDPDGTYFLDQGATDTCDYDGGNWADEWCAANPGECSSCSCAHSRSLNCDQKAKAFWWMMARLAGWEGPGGDPPPPPDEWGISACPKAANQNDTVTYTLIFADFDATVSMTATVPSDLSYQAGSLAATSGDASDSAAPELHWTGHVSAGEAVTVTYRTTVTTSDCSAISTQAQISEGGQASETWEEVIVANGELAHLPVVLKE